MVAAKPEGIIFNPEIVFLADRDELVLIIDFEEGEDAYRFFFVDGIIRFSFLDLKVF